MQERYLGDSHDFLKYAILRGIATDVTQRIGLNWYLTSPKNVESSLNNHGEKRHHLSRPEWRKWDSELLVALERYADPVDRNIAHFQQSGTLPAETVYFAEEVPTNRLQRREWKQRSLNSFAETDVGSEPIKPLVVGGFH